MKYKITCIIDSFNYAEYIEEAIDSAINQVNIQFDEIIIVDDGSTDNTQQLLINKYSDNSIIKLIFKENQGQLSAFHRGVQEATGDIIYFLDSDDKYKNNYLSESIKYYQQYDDCDLLFVDQDNIGLKSDTLPTKLVNSQISTKHKVYKNLQSLSALTTYPWIGAATSMCSAKSSYLKKLFANNTEIPKLYSDWTSRADDYIMHGFDMMNATKYYLAHKLVEYRIHDNNASTIINKGQDYKAQRKAKLYKLLKYLMLEFICNKRLQELALKHLDYKFKKANYSIDISAVLIFLQDLKIFSFQQKCIRFLIFILAYIFKIQGSVKHYL